MGTLHGNVFYGLGGRSGNVKLLAGIFPTYCNALVPISELTKSLFFILQFKNDNSCESQSTHIHSIYRIRTVCICIYIYMCVCVCVSYLSDMVGKIGTICHARGLCKLNWLGRVTGCVYYAHQSRTALLSGFQSSRGALKSTE